MANNASLVEFILDQLGEGVRARPMFGEFGVYRHGQLIALICDDQLFLKPTQAVRSILERVEEAAPYPGAKPYLLVSEELWDDRELMQKLAELTGQALQSERPVNGRKPKPAASRARKAPPPQERSGRARKASPPAQGGPARKKAAHPRSS